MKPLQTQNEKPELTIDDLKNLWFDALEFYRPRSMNALFKFARSVIAADRKLQTQHQSAREAINLGVEK